MQQQQEAPGVLAFQQAVVQHKLVAGRCRKCNTLHVPPRPLCGACSSLDVATEELSGYGRLLGVTAIHVPPTFMQREGFGRERPYLAGVVELDEGPRITARIVCMDALKPEQIAIGARVMAMYSERNVDGKPRTWLAFGPAPQTHGSVLTRGA